MTTKKIVITGGPSTGKTAIINHLEQQGEICFHEISRTIILEAQKQGIEQLFLKDPTLFSQKLLEERVKQFITAKKSIKSRIFIDRGIPDIIAYMDYIKTETPPNFTNACNIYRYDYIFLLPPWKDIHTTDNERYENFEQAKQIHLHLSNTYTKLGYKHTNVPFGTIKERSDFIIENIK